jgi:hypothetical protein
MTTPFQNLTYSTKFAMLHHKDLHVTHKNAKPIIILFSLLSFHHIKRPDFLATFNTWKGEFYIKNKTTNVVGC